jgi:uncharacterized protein
MTKFDLRQAKLRPGEEYRDEQEIALSPFDLGGQRYLPVPENVTADLAITRGTSGTTFELRFPVRLHGPCYRCLRDAVLDLSIRAREYQATSPGESDELRTPYVRDNQLFLSDWARDAIAVELPEQILHSPDCAGLCAICGEDLNDNPHEHEDETQDPRWAALEGLKDRL